MITLDADTLLHKSAVRYLVARIESAPSDVCAVAGAVLVKTAGIIFSQEFRSGIIFLE